MAKGSTWDPVSGLPDDFDLWITSSTFGYLDEYQNGQAALLLWDGESPDSDLDRPVIWSIGKDWEVREKGAKVINPKRGSDNQRFIDSSTYGILLKRMSDLGKEVLDVLKSRGPANEAKVWEGLGFHLKREKIVRPGAASRGMIEEQEHLMPTAFLGVKGKGKGTSAKAEPKSESKSEPTPVSESESADGNDKLLNSLFGLAQSLDYKKFVKAAMAKSELEDSDNSELLAAVLDEGPDGFWAKARAK